MNKDAVRATLNAPCSSALQQAWALDQALTYNENILEASKMTSGQQRTASSDPTMKDDSSQRQQQVKSNWVSVRAKARRERQANKKQKEARRQPLKERPCQERERKRGLGKAVLTPPPTPRRGRQPRANAGPRTKRSELQLLNAWRWKKIVEGARVDVGKVIDDGYHPQRLDGLDDLTADDQRAESVHAANTGVFGWTVASFNAARSMRKDVFDPECASWRVAIEKIMEGLNNEGKDNPHEYKVKHSHHDNGKCLDDITAESDGWTAGLERRGKESEGKIGREHVDGAADSLSDDHGKYGGGGDEYLGLEDDENNYDTISDDPLQSASSFNAEPVRSASNFQESSHGHTNIKLDIDGLLAQVEGAAAARSKNSTSHLAIRTCFSPLTSTVDRRDPQMAGLKSLCDIPSFFTLSEQG